MYRGITISSTFTEVTPGPISLTIPAPSCPRITGNSPSGSSPDRVNASVWQTPVAFTSIKTSPALGPSRSTSTISRGSPEANATAALDFIFYPFCLIENRIVKELRLFQQINLTIHNSGLNMYPFYSL